jgi:uncharacterized membrane protein
MGGFKMKKLFAAIVIYIKEYLKYGLSIILPAGLVFAVGYFVYKQANLIFGKLSIGNIPGWTVPILGLIAIFLLILTLGVIFKNLKVLRWIKSGVEKYIINNVPILNKIYNFGKEITDTFIADVKEDGDMTVVEVTMGTMKMMGLLTDVKNDLVFVVSAPSPLTGFVIKTKNYRILDMSYIDLIQINTSLGRISGSKWTKGITKRKWAKLESTLEKLEESTDELEE